MACKGALSNIEVLSHGIVIHIAPSQLKVGASNGLPGFSKDTKIFLILGRGKPYNTLWGGGLMWVPAQDQQYRLS